MKYTVDFETSEIVTTLVWNQACVSVMERSNKFMALHRLTREILRMDIKEWEFPPPLKESHLSHFYGTTALPPHVHVDAAPNFVATEAAIWETSGGFEGVKNWKKLETIKLSKVEQ